MTFRYTTTTMRNTEPQDGKLEPAIEIIDCLLSFYREDCQDWLDKTKETLRVETNDSVEELDTAVSDERSLPQRHFKETRAKPFRQALLSGSGSPRGMLEQYQEIMKSRLQSVSRTRHLVSRARRLNNERRDAEIDSD